MRALTLQRLARGLLFGIETRGRDATGYAYVSVKDGYVSLCKAPVKATDFLELKGHLLTKPKINRMPRCMILHTRAATQGKPSNNLNNHPIYSKASGLCMIHNGWISNDDVLASELKLKRDAEVDSEIYLKLIEHQYLRELDKPMQVHVQAATSQVYGSLACAMIQGGHPDKLWVWRDSGSLAIVQTDWGWAFASTHQALLGALIYTSSSFDGSNFKLFEPPVGSFHTITGKGCEVGGGITGADWMDLPDYMGSRVNRTITEGRVSNVRRVSRQHVDINEFDWSEYNTENGRYNGYVSPYVSSNSRYSGGNVTYYGRTKRKLDKPDKPEQTNWLDGFVETSPKSGVYVRKPAATTEDTSTTTVSPMVRAGKKTSQSSEKTSANALRETDPRKTYSKEICERFVETYQNTRAKDCYCREDYVCFACDERDEYFAHSVPGEPGSLCSAD